MDVLEHVKIILPPASGTEVDVKLGVLGRPEKKFDGMSYFELNRFKGNNVFHVWVLPYIAVSFRGFLHVTLKTQIQYSPAFNCYIK